MSSDNIKLIKSLITEVPDYPKEGILFKDITTLLSDNEGFRLAVEEMGQKSLSAFDDWDVVAGAESRGFIFGVPLALDFSVGVGFVPVRKPGKLPREVHSESYELEYGTDTLEVHQDAFEENQPVLFVDDLLATGGTAEAAIKLLRKAGADVVGACFLIELEDLKGRDLLQKLNVPVVSVIQY